MNEHEAVNISLRQAIHENGIPYELKLNFPHDIIAATMAEGRVLARAPDTIGYSNMADLRTVLKKI